MDLKRMNLDFETDEDYVRVFHTSNNSNGDPNTIVVLNGEEITGKVCYSKITDDEFLIRIMAKKCHF